MFDGIYSDAFRQLIKSSSDLRGHGNINIYPLEGTSNRRVPSGFYQDGDSWHNDLDDVDVTEMVVCLVDCFPAWRCVAKCGKGGKLDDHLEDALRGQLLGSQESRAVVIKKQICMLRVCCTYRLFALRFDDAGL